MSDLVIFNGESDEIRDIRQLQTILNREPDQQHIQINKWAGNSKYLPISHLEAQLDFLFPVWNWEIDNFTREQNHMIVKGHLTVYFKGQVFRKLAGIGARSFQVDKGAHFADFSKMKPNAVEQSTTVAAAYAFRNAAQKLGKLFGRDLNRTSIDQANEQLFTLKENLENAKSVKELVVIWNKIPVYLRKDITPLFTELKESLTPKKKKTNVSK